jgi:hypothetical protein
MASKGGVIAVGAIAGVAALLFFTKKAKAATPGGGPEPEVSPHTPAACAAAMTQRAQFQNGIAQINAELVDIDAARIAAAQNGDQAQLDNLNSIRANMVNTRNNYQAEVNSLNTYIADCP